MDLMDMDIEHCLIFIFILLRKIYQGYHIIIKHWDIPISFISSIA